MAQQTALRLSNRKEVDKLRAAIDRTAGYRTDLWGTSLKVYGPDTSQRPVSIDIKGSPKPGDWRSIERQLAGIGLTLAKLDESSARSRDKRVAKSMKPVAPALPVDVEDKWHESPPGFPPGLTAAEIQRGGYVARYHYLKRCTDRHIGPYEGAAAVFAGIHKESKTTPGAMISSWYDIQVAYIDTVEGRVLITVMDRNSTQRDVTGQARQPLTPPADLIADLIGVANDRHPVIDGVIVADGGNPATTEKLMKKLTASRPSTRDVFQEFLNSPGVIAGKEDRRFHNDSWTRWAVRHGISKSDALQHVRTQRQPGGLIAPLQPSSPGWNILAASPVTVRAIHEATVTPDRGKMPGTGRLGTDFIIPAWLELLADGEEFAPQEVADWAEGRATPGAIRQAFKKYEKLKQIAHVEQGKWRKTYTGHTTPAPAVRRTPVVMKLDEATPEAVHAELVRQAADAAAAQAQAEQEAAERAALKARADAVALRVLADQKPALTIAVEFDDAPEPEPEPVVGGVQAAAGVSFEFVERLTDDPDPEPVVQVVEKEIVPPTVQAWFDLLWQVPGFAETALGLADHPGKLARVGGILVTTMPGMDITVARRSANDPAKYVLGVVYNPGDDPGPAGDPSSV